MVDPSFPPASAAPRLTPEAAEFDTHGLIECERVRTLYALTPQSLVGGTVFAVVMAWAVWGSADPRLIACWLVPKLAMQFWRGLDWWLWLRQQPGVEQIRGWRVRHALGSGLDGVTWGLAGPLFIPSGNVALDGMLVAGLVGVASVGVFTLTSLWADAVRFMVAVLLPMGLQHLLMANKPGLFLALAMLIYLLVLYAECRKAEQRQTELLELRFKNAAILAQHRQAVALAEHSNAAKSRFLAMVSHELRTPLNGIVGMAELIGLDGLRPRQQERLTVLQQSALHLQTLIGDLLDISRIEFGRLDIHPQDVRLRPLITEVCDLLAPVAAERGLDFQVQIDPKLPASAHLDPARVKQVLHNLIGNALKFTAQGWVRLEVGCDDAPPSDKPPAPPAADAPGTGQAAGHLPHKRLVFRVSDSGRGIAPEDMARIFEAFEQGSQANPDTRQSGTGLGLTISRQLAQTMGGTVTGHSSPGQGATFVFTLVWQPATAALAAAPAASPAPPMAPALPADATAPRRILLVEDNPVNAMVALGLLEALGETVDWVENGALALEHMAQGRYGAVLMDCQMPVLDGWQATQRWRAHEQAHPTSPRRLPIIALTANAVLGDRERCLAAGMDDYLAKPFDGMALQAVLSRHLP